MMPYRLLTLATDHGRNIIDWRLHTCELRETLVKLGYCRNLKEEHYWPYCRQSEMPQAIGLNGGFVTQTALLAGEVAVIMGSKALDER